MKKVLWLCFALLLTALSLNPSLLRGLTGLTGTPSVARAEIAGKDGDLVVTAPGTIVNKYARLAVDVPAGSSLVSIDTPVGPNGLAPSMLTAGDLIMLIQLAGASIDTTDTPSYGTVTNINSAGRHEFVTVNAVNGNVITINPPCGGLKFNYTVTGKTQVIRVPQYTSLTINAGGTLTAPAWDGVTGGIVAVHVQNNAVINGSVDVSGLGFRGGALAAAGGGGLRNDYRTTQQDNGAEKGEGIAGYQVDYDLLGGRYGRGAAANAGGGGTAHNSGGGGGANGNNARPWTGAGVMDGTVTGAVAWALDPDYMANGNALTNSAGGGRGGYSYAVANQDALTVGPGRDEWLGDKRRSVGGLGGRPVAQDTTGRVFLGGGGGAGAQNNDSGGAGGSGGGLIYLISDNGVSGSGTLRANGANGGNTRNEHRDGAGGGGAGGTIVISAKSLSGLSAEANGGNGGNQSPPVAPYQVEAEGPGGGGGGGYIAYSGGTLTTQVNGGVHGTTQAPSLAEFPVNGATRGATGATSNVVSGIPFCSTNSDLTITKTNNTNVQAPGAPTTYTITAKNNGPNDVFGIPVKDTLAAVFTNASWTCTASTGSNCFAATGTGNIDTKVNLLNGGTATFQLTATVDPSTPAGSVTNTATIAPPDGAVDTNPGNNSATDTDTLAPQADLSITKSDGVTSVTAGTTLAYTITVRNNGPSTVNGAQVTDAIPAKLTNATWSCTPSVGASCAAASGTGSINTTVNLLPNATATFSLRATVIAGATGSLINTATVTPPAAVPDNTPDNNSATDTDTIGATADLSITKTGGQALVPGAQTSYQIVVGNNGPSAAIGAQVTDTLPAGLINGSWTCTASSGSSCPASGTGSINTTVDVQPGGTATFTLTATVAPNATGTIANSATVTPPNGTNDPSGSNNSSTVTATLTPQADLSITKTNNANTVVAGMTTTYTITARNNGPSTVSNATVTDVLPAKLTGGSWTCAASSGSSCGAASGQGNIAAPVTLQPAGTATFTVTATVLPDATGDVINTASIAVPNGVTDPTPANNSATDTDTISFAADLSVTKTNSATSVVAGLPTTYTITVRNNGPSAVNGVSVNDALPASLTNASWTCAASSGSSCAAASGTGNIATTVNLLNGGTATFTLTATVASSATGTIANTAIVATPNGTTDPSGGNNTSTTTIPVTQTADLSIVKTAGSQTAVPGGPISYQIAVSNSGPSAIAGAAVVDTLPATLTGASWTCTASSGSSCAAATGSGSINTTVNLAAGGTATFALTATVSPNATGTIANSATVTAPNGATDPGGNNNSSTVTTTLTPQAELVVTKTNNATTVTAGLPTTYTITVRNNGPSAVTGATVNDPLPAALTNASWTCAATTGSSCAVPTGTGSISTTVNLLNGGTATFQLTATIASDASGQVSNTVTANTPTGVTRLNSSTPTATDTDTVNALADISITKTNNTDTITAGVPTTYTITVRNNGPSAANGITVNDTMPASMALGSWTCAASQGSSCAVANGQGNINTTVNLAAGGTATFQLTATDLSTAVGQVTNTATATVPATVTDPTPANNSASDTDTIRLSSDLSITKTGPTGALVPGTQVLYRLLVNNTGPSSVVNAAVKDTLPAALTGATWTCIATFGSSCAAPSGTGSVDTTVNLVSGGNVNFEITATIAPGATGSLVNTATVAAPTGTTDPATGNNSSTVTNTLNPTADLSILKTLNTNPVIPGGLIKYTIEVSNAGPSAVTGAPVVDTLAAALLNATWTCTATSNSSCGAPSGNGSINTTVNLQPGGKATFTLNATVADNTTGQLVNTATVSAPPGVTDPTPNNGSSTSTTPVQPSSDLRIVKTANAASVRAGDEIIYTLAVTNLGPSAADSVVVTDALPAGLTLKSATASQGACTGTDTVTCSLGKLNGAAPGNAATITIRAQVNVTYTPGPLANIATVATTTSDPVGGNNTSTSTITITPPPGANFPLSGITSRVTNTDLCIGNGAPLTFEVKIKNTGDGTQRNNPTPEFTATLPSSLSGVIGSCQASTGTCTAGLSQVEWNGELAPNETLTITYRAVVRALPPGTRACTDYTINFDTNSDGLNDATTRSQFCVTGNCTAPTTCGTPGNPDCPQTGPGDPLALTTPALTATGSDQRPGSVLIFPIYTSSTSSSTSQNTRISITNTDLTRPAILHMFFVDGTTCSIADNYICLTANQTTSFLASDLDPDVTGYIFAVAVNATGCPINFNYLIGDEFVKFTNGGHTANLGAEAVPYVGAALSGAALPGCDATSGTAALLFDGTANYARLGRVLAADSLPSVADGNSTKLILDRIEGDLSQSGTSIGNVAGVLFNDVETPYSFGFTAGGCQLVDNLGAAFPRTTPRYTDAIPAGRTGWMKLYINLNGTGNSGALIGATINAASTATGFRGGHNLHKLTLANSSVITIPVFPTACTN